MSLANDPQTRHTPGVGSAPADAAPPPPTPHHRSRWARWNPRHWLRVILSADDTPHSIALGTAIGIFVGLSPTIFIQTPIVLLLAAVTRRFFKFNIIAAVIAGQITNPLTNVPIYWGEYIVGTWFVESPDLTFERFAALFRDQDWSEWWIDVKLLAVDFGKPLLIGSAIVSTLCGLATYPLMKRLVASVKRLHRSPMAKKSDAVTRK